MKKYHDLLKICFPDIDALGNILLKRQRFPIYIFTMEKGKNVVGGVSVVRLSERVFEIYFMAIHPDYQGKGYGKKLMEEVHKQLKGIFLTKTREAKKFYEKLGYKVFHKGKKHDYLAYSNMDSYL